MWFVKTFGSGAPRSPCCHLGQAPSLNVVPPFALPAVSLLPGHRVFSLPVGCCYSHGAGTVDHSGGLFPVGRVVLLVGFVCVASGPVVLGRLSPCCQ